MNRAGVNGHKSAGARVEAKQMIGKAVYQNGDFGLCRETVNEGGNPTTFRVHNTKQEQGSFVDSKVRARVATDAHSGNELTPSWVFGRR